MPRTRNLPRMDRPNEAPPCERPLLIVDDDPDAHFFLKRALARVGVKLPVHGLFGGQEAIRYFENALSGVAVMPCLVFLDIKMPQVDGFDLLQWLRDHELLGRTVVAMLSGSEDPKDVSRAMALGAHTFLTKPAKPDLLLEITQSAIRLASRRLRT